MPETKVKHKEAFCLMWYVCRSCGHSERIWNSRDGVTPFSLACFSCGKIDLMHARFDLDVPAPDHKPHRGQRFWRDGTPDEAETILRARVAKMNADPRNSKPGGLGIMPPEQLERMVAEARAGTWGEFQKGWPYLDQVPLDRDESRVLKAVRRVCNAECSTSDCSYPQCKCEETPHGRGGKKEARVRLVHDVVLGVK